MVLIMMTTLYAMGLDGEAGGDPQTGGWRLRDSPSAYLREHAENPVEWWTWGDEAFEAARNLDRPVFLSIGYSSCHWCHVMRRESFSDPAIAAFLNAHFISIKVDREDQPHVDEVYMDAVRAMTGGGGWPLSAFLLPDGKPFYGGTYFPPRQRFNRPGFLELISSIEKAWREDRARMQESAEGLIEHLEGRENRVHEGQTLDLFLSGGVQTASATYTANPAGFGQAPRFPAPRFLEFLAGEGLSTQDIPTVNRSLAVLREMARGGILDQVGGGFHRYSVDAAWQVPHFEKMLYNQGSLAESYLEVGRMTGESDLLETGKNVLDAMLKQFQLEDGSFASSWDADSGGVEGSYYVWTPDQVNELLPEGVAKNVCEYLGISEDGNFEELEASVPRQAVTYEALSQSSGLSVGELRKQVEDGIAQLLEARESRVAPKRDDKVILGWNALSISGLARGAAILGETRFADEARRAHSAVAAAMVTKDGFLRRVDHFVESDGSHSRIAGNAATLQDAALWVKCCLDLYEATFDSQFLQSAEEAVNLVQQEFGPLEEGHGFYEAPNSIQLVVDRRRDYFDGALPSGNATMARNLLRMYELTGNADHEESALHLVTASLARVGPYPMGAAELLLAVQSVSRRTPVVAIVGDPDLSETREMIRAARNCRLSQVVIAFRSDLNGDSDSGVVPVLKGRNSKEGKPLAYLCIDQVCEVPFENVGELTLRLSELEKRSGSPSAQSSGKESGE